MAEIFISHSANDADLVDFFSRIGARTKVRLVFEELERIIGGAVSAEQVRKHIAASNALFLLLSRHIQAIPHTRDWVVSEAGVASNKDIWVFERASDSGSISVVTPFLRHYVLFDPGDAAFAYLTRVVESYDDSHVLGTMVATGGLGAAFGGGGALIGAIAGAFMADKSGTRPQGLRLKCAKCASSYNAHIPGAVTRFRCPVCNTVLALPPGAGTAPSKRLGRGPP